MKLTTEEINRKLLHILSGTLIPAGIFYIPMMDSFNRNIPVYILSFFLVVSVTLEFIRFKVPSVQSLFMSVGGSMLRKSESREITGATYIFASALLCSVLFYDKPHISFMVISLFILGDAIAALVGISIGRIKIAKKSLEGSLACFALSLLLLIFIFPHIPMLLDSWNRTVPIPLALIMAFLITIQELFPIKIGKFTINDNLTVPVITGFITIWIAPYFLK